MKKFSKKGVLLFAAAMALCAFAMPTTAGALSWTVVGSHHTLNSANVGFEGNSPALGTVTSQCTASSFTTTVSSATDLRITAATFGGDCTAHGPVIGTCGTTATAIAASLPWTATAVGSTNVQIHGIQITVQFDAHPTGTCNIIGADLVITGTINSNSVWDNTGRRLTLNGAEGLTSDSAAGNFPVTATGTFIDAQQTLILDHP
jgi:hypothetical protein